MVQEFEVPHNVIVLYHIGLIVDQHVLLGTSTDASIGREQILVPINHKLYVYGVAEK